MLDIKFIRENTEAVKANLVNRHNDFDLDEVIELDRKRRELLQMTEALKSERNAETKKIALAKKNKEDASAAISAMREVGTKIAAIDKELAGVELILQDRLLRIPNMTDASVPVGKDDSENPEVRRWGEIRKFPFPAKEHYELGENLGILDSERAGKVSGARFYFYLSMAARLERAVYNFMLDVHTQQNDFTEVIPPYIINGASMQGTGQLPKFEDDMYKVEGENMYMTPTAEVPLTNYFSGEILDGAVLPVHLTALTPCFRKEAGSAGKDTRGLIRQHQFHKVEMVKYCKPEDSWDELEKADDFDMAVHDLIKKYATEHQRIVFNGNGYSDEWVEEAERRGLPNIKSMVDAIPALNTEKAVALFEKFGVFTKAELDSRVEIEYETYAKEINIEAKAMIDIATKQIIPAVIRYTTTLAESINAVKAACGADISVQTEILVEVSDLLADTKNALSKLEEVAAQGAAMAQGREQAVFYRDEVMTAMKALRTPVDRLEMLVDKSMWPMPSYGDLMFEV